MTKEEFGLCRRGATGLEYPQILGRVKVMAYVPGCSADVFISYAHDDNLDGWVTRLKETLTQKLKPFLAGRAEVWFDDDDLKRPGVYLQKDIQERLKNTPILVAVVSPSYIDSDFCVVHELEWFQNHGGREIVQLVKVPLEESQDFPVPDAHYIPLFDKSDGHTLADEPLGKALDQVVLTMATRLRELWGIRPKVYLAQLRDESSRPRWEELKQALHVEGYAILPKYVLRERGAEPRIREWLEDAGVSIHLSTVREDSLARTQLETAKQVQKPAIILDRPPRSDEVAAVIAEVQRKLEADRRPAIYPIYDHHSDGRWASGLCELLAPRTGYDFVLPEAGETYHKYMLRVSEGIVLFRAAAPEAWLQSQKQVLLQAAALRGDRFVPEAWYFVRRPDDGPPAVHHSEGLRHECIIERTGEPTVEDLEPFVTMLRSHARPLDGKGPEGKPPNGRLR